MKTKALSSAIALALASVSLAAPGAFGQQAAPAVEFPAPSPAATLKQRVGLTDIEVVYSRPGVKGRPIFGGLVPYDAVWRAGANNATKIVFSTPVKFGGTSVPAGTYGLFAIPGKSEWTVILSKVPGQWGAYAYKQEDDQLRVKAKAVTLAESVESYTIDINEIRDQSATLNLIWEKLRVPVKIEVDVASTVVPKIEAAISAPGTNKTAGLYYSSALFFYENGQDLKKAKTWVDEAVKLNDKAPYMMLLKARIHAKLGEKDAAIAAARKTSELGIAAEGPNSGFVKMSNDLIASLK